MWVKLLTESYELRGCHWLGARCTPLDPSIIVEIEWVCFDLVKPTDWRPPGWDVVMIGCFLRGALRLRANRITVSVWCYSALLACFEWEPRLWLPSDRDHIWNSNKLRIQVNTIRTTSFWWKRHISSAKSPPQSILSVLVIILRVEYDPWDQ